MNGLFTLGWDDVLQARFDDLGDPDLRPARVAVVERGRYELMGLGEPPRPAVCTGRLLHRARGPLDLPTVGDWVAVRPGETPARITAVLPRRSIVVRKAAGREALPQAVAANLDTVVVVTDAGPDLNARRLERYLIAIRQAGAAPLVAVNKTDLPHDAAAVARVLDAMGVDAVRVSALAAGGAEPLARRLRPGRTVALIGSSGVGKSSLINALLGTEVLATAEVRARDARGQHTTTRRALMVTPGGAVLIDTPGMRELGLWEASGEVDAAFDDVGSLAARCRFRDCTHQGEPGCAVAEAVAAGLIDADRLESLHRLQREAAFLERRADAREASNSKRRTKEIARSLRELQKLNRKLGLKDG